MIIEIGQDWPDRLFLLDLSSIIYHTGMLEQQEIIIDHQPDTNSDNQSQQDLFWFIDT